VDSVFKDGFRFAVAAGSVHWFKKGSSEAMLRSLITRNGGEELNEFWMSERP